MRLPRKGVLIRLCIYLPLLGYFGWRAFDRWWTETHPPADATEGLEPYKRTISLPDGTQHEVIEMTREQAEEKFGPLPPEGGPTPGTVKAGEPPSTAKAPTADGKAQ